MDRWVGSVRERVGSVRERVEYGQSLRSVKNSSILRERVPFFQELAEQMGISVHPRGLEHAEVDSIVAHWNSDTLSGSRLDIFVDVPARRAAGESVVCRSCLTVRGRGGIARMLEMLGVDEAFVYFPTPNGSGVSVTRVARDSAP